MGQMNPRPLTRKEFAEFAPNQRAIRAFEDIFRQVDSLENPVVLNVEEDLTASIGAYVLIARLTGITITFPKASFEIIGRVWSFTLGVSGTLTIETQGGDTFPTAATPTETTEIITTRGETVSFRCVAEDQWIYA